MKELVIQHMPADGGAGARVRVSYSAQPGAQPQERVTDFAFAVTEAERRDIQWYLEEYLTYPWGEFRQRARQVEALTEQMGTRLFDAVFADRQTFALYAHVADQLAQTRIKINAADAEGIALPWEFMRDATRGEHGDLARLAHAFVRSQPDLIFEPPAPVAGPTFNILMIICRPGGPESDVPFQSVARPLLELFRPHRERIRLDILRPPTFERLTRVLSDQPNFYHVLHFDGHGVFPPGASTHGLLEFEGEADETRRPVTGAELGGLLAGRGVPVVLLNACQSGMTHPEALYPSVGNELLKAGTGGVVAMAYSVYVQSAVRFMARLYEALIKGEELARAVALAREDLRAHPQRFSPIGDVPLRDWVVPVLFEAVPVRPFEQPVGGLQLSPSLLKNEQAQAGAEIDLPEPPAFGFVGRDGVTLELERAFRAETVVLLEGMAGVGKTEMTAGFARWWAETGALDGPSFFFRFEHYLPLAQVCDRVGQVFGAAIKKQLQVEWQLLTPEQRRQVALSVLRQVRCLFIWDNFEPVAGFPTGTPSAWKPEEQQELRAFLGDLRGGETRVLITSRRNEPWLGPIYRRVQIGGLKLIEAQELALRVLRRAGLNPTQIRRLPAYNKLLKYLRGNPLAIQAILPELARMTPEKLLTALQAGEVKLTADDPAQGRERSLAASLTYRLDALDATLRQRLGVLALFQGFVSADVLANVCQQDGAPDVLQGLGRAEWIQILDKAAEVGLVRRAGEGSYTVHPALPWFFHDLLRESFPAHLEWLEQTFAAAYAAYGSYLNELFKTKAELAMSLLRAEEGNLLHALRVARRRGDWDSVAGLLYGLRQLLTTQGRWVERERLVVEIEGEITDTNGEPLSGREELWISLLGHRAEIASHRRDFDVEQAILLRLKEHYERMSDERNVAVAFHRLGVIALGRRRFDEAERWYQESLAINERICDEYGQALTLHQLGRVAQERRRFDEAERWYRQALAIMKHIGDEDGQAGALHQLGVIAQGRQQFEEAEQCYRQSLAIKERIGNERGQASTLHQLGMVAGGRQQFEEAERYYRRSLAIEERIGDEYGQALTLHELGMNAQAQRRFDEAERWYRRSLAIKERIGNEYGQASTLNQLGRVAEKRGNAAEAISFYEQAEALMARLDDPYRLEIVRESLRRVREGGGGEVK
ncbi:MAG TPA: tetratricopeptide repeat protein [Pyrinomonadaceae bacterium]